MTQRPALKPLVYYNVQLCGARTAARYHFHDVWMTMLIIVQYSAPAVYIRGAGAHWGHSLQTPVIACYFCCVFISSDLQDLSV